MTPQIAILTLDDVQRIIREAYEAGKAAIFRGLLVYSNNPFIFAL